MKQKFQILLVFAVLTFVLACDYRPESAGNTEEVPAYVLSAHEKNLCNSQKIDTAVVQAIRLYNFNEIEPFHYSLSKIIENGMVREADPVYKNGLMFNAQNRESYDLVLKLKERLKAKGCFIFVLENNFDINKQPDRIGVLKTTDQYKVLKDVGTDGINYGITNDSLIAIVKQFNTKYSLDLISAFGDGCEFIIQKQPADWLAFANEVYEICPDVVDQGAGTVKALAEEMKKTNRLYFWWD